MAIKDITGFQQTLGKADATGWAREINKPLDFETPGVEAGGGKSFGELLSESIGKVNAVQQEANIAMEKLASGESQNLHETLLAVEKADIAFRTMNQIRTKVLDAYREIMKMQI
jgi:flagellar hook-basal body complex protein FliE